MKITASEQSIAQTLTRAERQAPFATSTPDLDPLPACTRTATLWDGLRFTEYDPTTWEPVALGEISAEASC